MRFKNYAKNRLLFAILKGVIVIIGAIIIGIIKGAIK